MESDDSSNHFACRRCRSCFRVNHRTAGEVLASKYALPRHAVVYFNAAGEPIASVNICFSCSDIMVWPNYGPDTLGAKKYKDWEKMEAIHFHTLSRWELFFDGHGCERYRGD